jgi:protoheme ferro-lyase
MSDNTPTGILVLAYGTPEKPEDIEPYYTHIRGGRPPSPESLHNLQERYRLVGGRTPLLDLSQGLADRLQDPQRIGTIPHLEKRYGLFDEALQFRDVA